MAEPVDQSVTLRQWIDVVRRARLGRTAKSVALMLATYADNDGSRVFPGVARLAVDCELTYNVIQNTLKVLREAGLIEVVRRAARRGQADEYRLILAADVLDRIEVLSPARVADAAAKLAAQRRGRYRPAVSAARAAPPEPDRALHPAAPGADRSTGLGLDPGTLGAADEGRQTAAPHGDGRTQWAAPHGDVHLHPAASPPTTHGPNHNPNHLSGEAVRADVAVVGAGETASPAGRAVGDRCVHGLDGRTGIRCPACRRGLLAHTADDVASDRPLLRLVRSA
ncbi:helix-turn-helix domain-containing protein [Dactylosporangium sp. NPDC048998]|uniref:helix-turn-helix domain-containing protein n=1 Tax=Dactylosporangium sp. NPDC048998 TaxID=3363976 RepID=UPI00371C8BDB